MIMALAVLSGAAAGEDAAATAFHQGIASEDSCGADDEQCVLSLRQLRGEALRAEVQEHQLDGDTEETTGGACKGQHGWNTDFSNHAYQCGLQSGGVANTAATCMKHAQGVSRACGNCMGKLIHCGMQCVSECCAGRCRHSAKCKACNNKKCDPAFYHCAGF